MRRPSEIPLLLHIAAHGWLGLAQVCVEAALQPKPEPPAQVEDSSTCPIPPMGPNGLMRSCQ